MDKPAPLLLLPANELRPREREQAAGKVIAENRSAYFPQLAGHLTAAQASGDTAVAAGALNTSSISTRVAGEISLLQQVTDFGRTNHLVRSARFSAESAAQRTETPRQQILRDVDEAYYGVQAAENVRHTAKAVVDFRRVVLRQLNALAQNQLRSTLDVQFAQVLVSEGELAVVRANSAVDERGQAASAALAHATSLFAYSRITSPFDGQVRRADSETQTAKPSPQQRNDKGVTSP
jgi:outer membrane protein